MSGGQGITQELGLGDVISRTFQLYRRGFLKYLILYVVTEAIIGVLDTLIRRAIIVRAAPVDATQQQLLDWLPGFVGAAIAFFALSAIVMWVFYTIALGSAVKMASEEIETGRTADLAASVRFTMSRLIWLWAVGLVVGIIVSVGLAIFFVPGVILSIMFSLVVPVVMIEGAGFASLGRSRKLVSHRWLKTLALFIVFGIIIGILVAIVDAVTAPLGVASTIISSVLAAFYGPLIPIALTVYYYSNAARIAPPPVSQAPLSPGTTVSTAMKWCPSCGTQIASAATFCPVCGAKQPV